MFGPTLRAPVVFAGQSRPPSTVARTGEPSEDARDRRGRVHRLEWYGVRRQLADAYPETAGAEVTVLDKLTYAGTLSNLTEVADSPRYRFVEGDICDVDLVNDLMPGFDSVVHFAAESHVDRSITGASDFVVTNVLGGQTLLQAALNAGVSRFVHVSTDEVYGSIPEGSWMSSARWSPTPRTAPPRRAPISWPGRTVARLRHGGLRRRWNNSVPPVPREGHPAVRHQPDGRPAGAALRRGAQRPRLAARRRPLSRNQPGAGQGPPAGETYNIGGGTELTNVELTERLLEAMGVGWEMVRRVEDRKGHDLRYSVDITKISSELGYTPEVPFEQGLADTVEWYRANEAWWRPLKEAKPAL